MQGEHESVTRRTLLPFAAIAFSSLILGCSVSSADDDPTDNTSESATDDASNDSDDLSESSSDDVDILVPPDREEPLPPDSLIRTDSLGAEAAAQYYLELHEYAFATGEYETFEEMSDSACLSCQQALDRIEMYSEDGLVVFDNFFVVQHIESFAATDDEPWHIVIIQGDQTPSTTVDLENQVVEQHEAKEYEMYFAIENSSGAWNVLELDVVVPGEE